MFRSYDNGGNSGAYSPAPLENNSLVNCTPNCSARNLTLVRYFTVSSTADASSTPAFSRNSYSHQGTSTTINDINIYDFTMNTSSTTITKGATANWTIAGNLVVGNGTVDFSSTSGTCDVSGTVNVEGGTLNLNGKALTLKSTSTSTARLAQVSGTLSGATNVTVERYIPIATSSSGRAWRLLTAPLRGNGSGVTLSSAWQQTNGEGVLLFKPGGGNGFSDAGLQANIRTYNSVSGWSALSNTDATNIIDNDGGTTAAKNNTYAVFVTGPHGGSTATSGSAVTTIKTTGKIVTGQQDFTVSSTNGQYNLIGNPYPSPIDLDLFSPANANVGSTFYVFNPNGGTVGQYITIQRNGSNDFTYTPNPGPQYRYIQSGQGFFVTSNGGGSTVSFQESHKVSNTITTVFRPGNGSIEKLGVNISFQNPDNSWQIADGVAAIYDNSYSTAVTDEFDALKFTNPNETVSLIRNGKNMAIEARPLIDTYDTAFINLAQMRAYTYKFDFMPSNMQAAGLAAFLQDAYTNTETAISLSANSVYQFVVNTDAGSYAANRFRIVYRPVVPLPVNFNGIKAYQKQDAIQVEWTVSNEINISKYEVEKSVNGRYFEKIEVVNPKGNATTETVYTALDAHPNIGLNYYRVKAVDKNGEVKYTEIAKVSFGKVKSSISVYPNPVTEDKLSINLNNFIVGKYELKVWNNIGQQVYQKSIEYDGINSQQIVPTSNWAKGMYRIVVQGQEVQLQQTIIKN